MIMLHTSWLLLEIPTWANDVHSFEYFAVNINFAVVRQNTGMEARYLTAIFEWPTQNSIRREPPFLSQSDHEATLRSPLVF